MKEEFLWKDQMLSISQPLEAFTFHFLLTVVTLLYNCKDWRSSQALIIEYIISHQEADIKSVPSSWRSVVVLIELYHLEKFLASTYF